MKENLAKASSPERRRRIEASCLHALFVVLAFTVTCSTGTVGNNQEQGPQEEVHPADDASVPADDTAPPTDDGSSPADDASVPVDDDEHLPADDGSLPEDDTTPPDDGSALPGETVVTVTNTVIVPNIWRFGINIGDDAPYDGAIFTKERIPNGGFEGVMYRTVGFGPGGTENSYWDWWDINLWSDLVIGANAFFLSGPRAWEDLVITGIETSTPPMQPSAGDLQRYFFTPSGAVPNQNDGFAIERIDDEVGYIGQHGGPYWVFTSGAGAVSTAAGDVPPDSRGKVVAVLDAPATTDVAELLVRISDANYQDVTGSWHFSMWAKGTGTLTVSLGDWNHRGPDGVQPHTIALGDEWQRVSITFTLDQYPDYLSGTLALSIHQTGGTAKIDELSFQQEGDTNPTPFRDDLIALLKRLNPGSIRHLQMGGSSIENDLRDSFTRLAYTKNRWDKPSDGHWPGHPNTNGHARIHHFSLHDFLELNKEVGSDPWYCTPGILRQHELEQLMEYLGGPVSTPMGALRAALGQATPWTQVFHRIHIEIGNEAWNRAGAYANGGYNGQEYWNSLFASAKASPYYSPNIVFHAGGQAVNTWLNPQIADRHPNADSLAVAPYVIHGMDAGQESWSTEELYSWLFGYPWYHGTQGYMAQNYQDITVERGMALSVYEVNHHITGGDAGEQVRNRLVTSIGGALNIINWMLMMLRDQHVRVQNFFSLFQFQYNAGAAGNVRLWGSVLKMWSGHERYRPTFLALMAANKALRGDLVEVIKSGSDPTWTNTYRYSDQQTDDLEIPYLHVYATRDGRQRGLILINLHRTSDIVVRLELPAEPVVDTIMRYDLTGPTIDANNEPEHDPEVTLNEHALATLGADDRIVIAAHSMTVLTWQE